MNKFDKKSFSWSWLNIVQFKTIQHIKERDKKLRRKNSNSAVYVGVCAFFINFALEFTMLTSHNKN